MRAIDTNIVVRYLTGDDPGQAEKAKKVIGAGDVFVGTTVFLESEWVLRSVYGFSGSDVASALRAFAGLPTIEAESPALLAEALDRMERGMDFADALHLGSAAGCEAMLSFDREFVEAARNEAVIVMEP